MELQSPPEQDSSRQPSTLPFGSTSAPNVQPASTNGPAPVGSATAGPPPGPEQHLTGPVSPDNAKELFGHMTDGPTATTPKPETTPDKAGATADKTGGTPAPAAEQTGGTPAPAAGAAATDIPGLDTQIDAAIKSDQDQRQKLDNEKKTQAPSAANTEHDLNTSRLQLLELIKQHDSLVDGQIADIDKELGPTVPKNPTPAQKPLVDKRAGLVKEKQKYAAQRTALERWSERRQMNDIDAKLQDPKLDPKEKADLTAQKKQIAGSLLSTTALYQQFDPRWGNTIYGKDKSYTSMTAAGCGPTGLADLLDFQDQEDPEGKTAAGHPNTITPRTVADYATNHGRVKGNGTDGVTMMNDLSQGFPGKKGQQLSGLPQVIAALRDGKPVLFLGHNITGENVKGQHARPYGGHYMVLNGVSDDGQTFEVHDGGRNVNANIRTITASQLSGHVAGYWIVE